MATYARNPAYSDLTKDTIPPTNGPYPIAPIDFSDEFIDVMSYFNALLQKSELSQRSLDITSDVIRLNPANYTAWHFRRRCLYHLGANLLEELDHCRTFARSNPKNYQIWYHRQALLDVINSESDELDFVKTMLLLDSKNYHAWTFRQWILTRFATSSLWISELEYVSELIDDDVFNYSAWSHRRFVSDKLNISTQSEMIFTIDKIKISPTNESPWMYLRGLRTRSDFPSKIFDYIVAVANDNRFAALVLAEHFELLNDRGSARYWFRKLSKIDSIRQDFWKREADLIE
ncbi:hypothetical protein P9112_000502 [Eukaryota sp. TZLM1-RC]